MLFTLVGLPLFIAFFLWLSKNLNISKTILLFLNISTAMTIAETLGLLTHHPDWQHSHPLIGYILYLTIIRLKWK
ncbi:hypothetical protein [Bacillus sp. B-jedd]|uniref:hypothetical protein n=1 Tax=Bacillus sp. B-jedd TaxID=1476857 RepID=UPI003FA4C053